MKKILIIENNKEEAKKYKNALSSIGFQVQIAESAIQGLRILNEEKFTLVILNIMLHDLHALSLIKKARSKDPNMNISFVILTDITDEDMIKEAYALQVSGYFIKSQHTPEQIADYVKKSLF